ncbi:hypothetical protein ACTJIJ_21615 [Niabella sp. 22666]|uniref:hypothetical protein n=1 Tax=Niabella sp. 22666 TaxID=3453954 RepID=UPI003F83B915
MKEIIQKFDEYYNDGILLDVESMVDAHPMKDDKTATRIVCHNLLRFVYDKGLLSQSPFNENGELKQGVIIKESDLSEKNKIIFWDLSEKWFTYTDRTQSYNNGLILEKWYAKM